MQYLKVVEFGSAVLNNNSWILGTSLNGFSQLPEIDLLIIQHSALPQVHLFAAP